MDRNEIEEWPGLGTGVRGGAACGFSDSEDFILGVVGDTGRDGRRRA